MASIVGGIVGYGIGFFSWWNGAEAYSAVALFFFNHIPGFTEQVFLNIQEKYEIYNFLIVFTAGFTPIPFKIITISAGAFTSIFPCFCWLQRKPLGPFFHGSAINSPIWRTDHSFY
ncbi:MAG: hypothetical protein CM1200mP10_16710 [Candidatus Neomarinimicrobiota bacterium]|nr:MAG: hypothetical protein CM1200mP10_16710 [Candidatus Neomarinimicrobiota bacterium]